MKQTTFKRKRDGKFFFLMFAKELEYTPNTACFRTVDGVSEHYFMDEVINNHKEFEQVDGELDFYTANKDGEIVRVNKYGELMRNPHVIEGKFYFLENTKRKKIDFIGAWDEDAKAYRVMYGGKKGGCGFDTDFYK